MKVTLNYEILDKVVFCAEQNDFILPILGTEYVYEYQTQLSLKSGGGREGVNWFEFDDKHLNEGIFSSESDSVRITTNVRIAKVWTGKEYSLLRFKV